MDKFCVQGELTNPRCVTFQAYDFDSGEQIVDILLDSLKSELPKRMAALRGCDNKPMILLEDKISIIPVYEPARFSVVLNPLNSLPKYSESLHFREVKHGFELILTVENTNAECVTWELMRFQNAVEGLIVGAEFAIDGYNSVMVEPDSFNYFIPEEGAGIFRRQGAYRFSVTTTQTRLF